jgi:anaerobic ribonucleoside-triphosphate reductase activating protein
MNYLGIEKSSISNGPGVRVVLWVSGCTCRCKGCQNPETWDFNSGMLFDDTAKQELFKALDKPYIQGITFSGGHPLENNNVEDVYLLLKEIKEKFPTKDVWLYTGYTWEHIFPAVCIDLFNVNHLYRKEVVKMCDVVVDGSYIEEQRDVTLAFRGSANQRIIDVKETLEQGKIVTVQN